MNSNSMKMTPRIAIVDQNTLEAMGLKSIISDIIPMVDVSVFTSLDALLDEQRETPFFHYFVSSQLLLANMDFFMQHPRQTIVLTSQPMQTTKFEHFHTLNTAQMEHGLIKSILQLHQHGHGNADGMGFHHCNMAERDIIGPTIDISKREAEVLALVVRGFINKEIADHLHISLPTVVTHRKNICDKLHIHSVSALTIYAVTHGIVRVEEI